MTNRRQLIEAVEVTDTGIHVARLKRIFDATSVNEFEKVLAYLISRKQYHIVVDLSQVEFVASAGWGAFTAEFRNVRKGGGDIRLAGMNPDVQDVFFLLELDSFINAYETVDEAIASFEVEMRAMKVETPVPTSAPPLLEIAPQREHTEPFAAAEDEPVAFAVTEIYAPEFRPPLALGSGNPQPPLPEYEPLNPTAEEEEGWVVSEEEETDAAASENYSEYASEITFDVEVDELEPAAQAEASSAEIETSIPTWPESESAMPAMRSANLKRTNGEEWPEAHAEENVASEDFELQDIHDPWILEEIDTLPEEDELEETEWNEEADDEAPVTAVKPGTSAATTRAAITATPAKPVTKAAAPSSERLANNARQHAPEPKSAPRASTPATPNTTPSLADRVKAANMSQTPQRTAHVGKERLEEDHLNLVRQIVSAHPQYGPAMIQKFCETRLEPPVPVSRSTVYRWLRLADLNTREQRLAFAGKASS